jgi:hypothetical protein
MLAFMRRNVWRGFAITFIALLLIVAALLIIAMAWLNPRLTRYIESDSFRAEMEKETAKGLHFPGGLYEPIKRTGTWTAETAGFRAKNGRKAMTSLDARGVTAKFNPWGVFLRRWQLDEVHVGSGEVGIQTYEPKPEPSPSKPWYHIFLPDRVYLRRVWSEPADVTWRFREERAGFFGTHLLITPHGRDFEYQARGGRLKMAPFPEMRLEHTHLLITKTLLTLYNLDLKPKAQGKGRFHAEGTAGTGEDKSIDLKIGMEQLPVDDWVPDDWREHVTGLATAQIHWSGRNPKLESSGGDASLRIDEGRVYGSPFLQKVATLMSDKSLERLTLNVCQLDLEWGYPQIDIKHLMIEEKGKFRAEGEVSVHKESLRGTVELGVAHRLLDWLPEANKVFPREHDGYRWTTVHLSGTIDAPRQDLSERIMEALKEHPTAALTLFLRQIGAALRHAFGQD